MPNEPNSQAHYDQSLWREDELQVEARRSDESPSDRAVTEAASPLTVREREVLQLAAEGQSTREIAEVLFLSPGTVKTHFHHIYEKLGVASRASAVARCLRSGLIE